MRTALIAAFVFWVAVLAYAVVSVFAADDEPHEFFFALQHETSVSFDGVQFFNLQSPKGSGTFAADADTELAKALLALKGQRIRVTFEPATVTLKRVER